MSEFVIANSLDEHGLTALEVGLGWSKKMGSKAFVIHADRLADMDALDPVFAHLNLEIQQQYLDNIVKANEDALIRQIKKIQTDFDDLEYKSFAGNPVDVIVSQSKGKDVQLTVLGQRQDKTWAEQFMGSVSEGVLHRNSKSVLVVKNNKALNPKKIMVAYDFSKLCDAAFLWAENLASLYKCEVHVVNIVPCYYEGYHVAHTMRTDFNAAIESMIDESVKKIDKRLSDRMAELSCSPVTKTIVDKEGSLSGKILEYCEENDIDLLLSGSHQRGKVTELFLGSVSNKLLKKSKCSILIAK